jgi:hypothetical protein
MPAPTPKPKSVADIKSQLLRPALTSNFQCWFNPPEAVRNWSKYKSTTYDAELYSLLCCDAALPGSSLATIDIDNDFHGVSQKNAYRRLYDDRADFTFYVDHDYNVIRFFESWISYTVNEQIALGEETSNYSYRVNYAKDYKADAIYVVKFERDFEGMFMTYRLLQAFPISINSMPVSYESSQLLKCTVSFVYERYLIGTDSSAYLPGYQGKILDPWNKNNNFNVDPKLAFDPSVNLGVSYQALNSGNLFTNNPSKINFNSAAFSGTNLIK